MTMTYPSNALLSSLSLSLSPSLSLSLSVNIALALSFCTHSLTANVCRVRTLRRMTMTYPGNALLWSNLGGIVMTPDGSAIIAGAAGY